MLVPPAEVPGADAPPTSQTQLITSRSAALVPLPVPPAEVSCWMTTGERQSLRMRQRYLGAVLRQEVAFFDTQASAGEVVSRVSSDMLLIQDAIGEKVRTPPHLRASPTGPLYGRYTGPWA